MEADGLASAVVFVVAMGGSGWAPLPPSEVLAMVGWSVGCIGSVVVLGNRVETYGEL